MDPHVDGNWRHLSLADFDARWWHKERDARGDWQVARRLAIVIAPREPEGETVIPDAVWIPMSRRGYSARKRDAVYKALEVKDASGVDVLKDGIEAARAARDEVNTARLEARLREIEKAGASDEPRAAHR
jgi:hypothetical protein